MNPPSPDPTGIEALARSAFEGSADLEQFARILHAEVFRWALLRTGHRADAEDISQEVTWKILDQRDSFAGPSWHGEICRSSGMGRV